jgi:hypothetical protein
LCTSTEILRPGRGEPLSMWAGRGGMAISTTGITVDQDLLQLV